MGGIYRIIMKEGGIVNGRESAVAGEIETTSSRDLSLPSDRVAGSAGLPGYGLIKF
jgi:hypothetical protein